MWRGEDARHPLAIKGRPRYPQIGAPHTLKTQQPPADLVPGVTGAPRAIAWAIWNGDWTEKAVIVFTRHRD